MIIISDIDICFPVQINFCQKMSSRILFHSKHLNCLPHRKWHRPLINVLPGRWSWSVTTGVKINFFFKWNEIFISIFILMKLSCAWSFNVYNHFRTICIQAHNNRNNSATSYIRTTQSDMKNRRTLYPPVSCILPSSCSVSPEYNYIWPSTG